MASKGVKETLANKLGFKNSGSGEAELERMRKENTQLKKTLAEMSKRNEKHTDRAKLLERIASLEALRDKNALEISTLRHQLQAGGGGVIASLQNQLEQNRKDAQQKEKVFHVLSQETEELKNKLMTFEKCSTGLQAPSGDIAMVQEQLRDALEKNQHWRVYDQQREAYVQGVLARMVDLEQQLNQAKQTPQEPNKEANSDDQLSSSAGKDQELVLQAVRRELEEKREQTDRLQAELEELRALCEENKHEAGKARKELQEERSSSRQMLAEERKMAAERLARMQNELEAADTRLEEERKRANELLLQVNHLQESLLKQHKEQTRITVLEQQVSRDSENEKLERQNLQRQLHKVLKELRKARDQIAHLESTKQQREARFSEPSSYSRPDAQDFIFTTTSPAKSHNMLDESFLECPKCRVSYPTSQHRELLMHLDYCFN